MAGEQKKNGGNKRIGRDKVKCNIYRLHQTREKHKIIKIARSNGLEAALKYAKEHNVLAFAQTRLHQFKESRHAPQ